MLKEKIYDISTGEALEREYSADEIAEVEVAQEKVKIEYEKFIEKQIARKAIFEKLGLTEEEVKLLLS